MNLTEAPKNVSIECSTDDTSSAVEESSSMEEKNETDPFLTVDGPFIIFGIPEETTAGAKVDTTSIPQPQDVTEAQPRSTTVPIPEPHSTNTSVPRATTMPEPMPRGTTMPIIPELNSHTTTMAVSEPHSTTGIAEPEPQGTGEPMPEYRSTPEPNEGMLEPDSESTTTSTLM